MTCSMTYIVARDSRNGWNHLALQLQKSTTRLVVDFCAGGVVAGVLAIAVLVLIILLVLVMLRQRRSESKDMSDEKTGSQPVYSVHGL